MSSGGGTTTQVSTTELPSWLQDAAQENLGRARMTADIGYVPQYGLDVAGFTPMQTSAMQNTANAASAFGLQAPTDVMANMPAQQTNNLGFSGYSSGALFDDALSQLQANRPAQYDYMNSMFIDPMTGGASVPSIMNTAQTDPTEALAMADARYNPSTEVGNADFEPISSAEAYRRAVAYLDPQSALDKGLKYAVGGPFGILDKLLWTPLHEANKAQYEAEIAGNEPFAGAYNLGGSGLTQNAGGGWVGSASDASRESSALDAGTGSGIGASGGNAAGGFSFGGW